MWPYWRRGVTGTPVDAQVPKARARPSLSCFALNFPVRCEPSAVAPMPALPPPHDDVVD